jgi:hypoxanthine phosphoribosyltransferase
MQRLNQKLVEKFDWYLAISRGGLIPATLLSHLTGVRKIDTLCLVSYTEKNTQAELEIIQKDYSHLKGQKVLIIDDLVDSGETMEFAMEYLKKFAPETVKTAVVFKKKHSKFHPDYFIEERSSEDWIDFPWEVDQSLEIK